MARKPTDTVQLKLRFSEALRRRLEREAKRRGLSLNTYIVSVLDGEFQYQNRVEALARAIADALRDVIVEAIAAGAIDVETRQMLADMQEDDLRGAKPWRWRVAPSKGEDKK
jgi:hypothetical protein